ncbi:MAG TPA: MmgE/PrpD family protein [Acidimicrobiales bacterium]
MGDLRHDVTPGASSSVTEELAEWIAGADFDDVPALAVRRVEERLLDSLGVQLGGVREPTAERLRAWIARQGAVPIASVVGTDLRTSPSFAALANATAGGILEFDDAAPFSGHPSNPLTAATLAVGEALGRSGAEVVLAWLVGWELTARTSAPCNTSSGHTLLNAGWHNEGFQTTLGVAAAAARLHDLDASKTCHAIGIAASSMGGMLRNRGTDAKWLHAGWAALHGVAAAELAADGFTADPGILDGPHGVIDLLAPGADPQGILEGLGRWELAHSSSWLRLHSSCAAAHWAQDALMQLLRHRPTAADEIEAIDVELNGYLIDMLPYQHPVDANQARFSLGYALAVIVLDHQAGIDDFTDERVARPEAQQLVARVRAHRADGEAAAAGPYSRVSVLLRTGERLEATVTVAHGSPEDPLTESELSGKFRECAGRMLPAERLEVIVGMCNSIASLPDVRTLMGLCSRSDTAP